MRKRFVLLLICAVCLLLAACAPGEAEDSGVMEEIRSAPVVKLEYARQEGGEPVFCYDPVSMSSLAEMRIQPSQGEFTEDWVYRFTYNPREKVIDGHEIVVLFWRNFHVGGWRDLSPGGRCPVWRHAGVGGREVCLFCRGMREHPCCGAMNKAGVVRHTTPAFSRKPLAKKVCSCYNRHEKQKCGSLRMRQHPQACAGAETTYTTAPGWPHRMDIIRRFRSSRKGWICRFLPIPVSHQERSLLASCRTASCTAFLFFTHRPGACPPPGPVR